MASGSPENLRSIITAARAKMRTAKESGQLTDDLIFQVEVDSLAQLAVVLQEDVDLILLDNMTLHELRQALTMREASKKRIPLEASGGVTLANVAQVAGTGVDRISVGSLTHSVTTLDIGLDWGE
jgi:nicotinate-nucleotide pyrophosphorylase (carboxylating)